MKINYEAIILVNVLELSKEPNAMIRMSVCWTIRSVRIQILNASIISEVMNAPAY